MDEKKSVRRFDVASILESAFEQNEWRGEDHHRGVFFTDDKGYCINKILAIRAEHDDKAAKVFYSFFAEEVDKQVTLEYPYSNMKAKPQKHHLLTDKEEIEESEIEDLFEVEPTFGKSSMAAGEIHEMIDKAVPNKRERGRTQTHLILKTDGITVKIIRNKRREVVVLDSKELSNIEHLYDNEEEQCLIVNANTLHTVLRIFPEKTKVLFEFSHDRMKLTGNLSTVEGAKAQVEIILAFMKG